MKNNFKLLYKPTVSIEFYKLIETKKFTPITIKHRQALVLPPQGVFKVYKPLVKSSRPAISLSQNISQKNISKIQALIRGFLTRCKWKLVIKHKKAIFPLTFLFKYLSENKNIRPVWEILKSQAPLPRIPTLVTKNSDVEPISKGTQRLPSEPKKVSNSKEERINKRRIKKAYAINLKTFVSVFDSIFRKPKIFALKKLQTLLPKYLKRRFYAIQKAMKAIIQVCVTNQQSFTFEIMKYALYSKTFTDDHSLLSFQPKFVEFLPEIIQIQKLVRGHLARKRTNTLIQERKKVKKSRKSRNPKFVINSRILKLKSSIAQIILRIKKDVMTKMKKNTGKARNNFYALQKASKKITGLIKRRVQVTFFSLANLR